MTQLHEQIRLMLEKQENLNISIHENWRAQFFNWPRAIWMECAELMDRLPWKWWKSPPDEDMPQIHLELVDIFHFGMSALLQRHTREEALDVLWTNYAQPLVSIPSLPEACDRLAASASAAATFNVAAFRAACHLADLSDDKLFEMYMGKHLLNEFRQSHGYRNSQYVKRWADGREDNEHLMEVMAAVPVGDGWEAAVWAELDRRYHAK